MKSISSKMDSTYCVSSWKYPSETFTKTYSSNFKYLPQKPNKHAIMTCSLTFLSSSTSKSSTKSKFKKSKIRMLITWKILQLLFLSFGVAEFASSENSSPFSNYFLRFIPIKRNSFNFHWSTFQTYQKKIFLLSEQTIVKMLKIKTLNYCHYLRKYHWMTSTLS